METINTIELSDPNIFPTEEILKNILGNTYSSYLVLLELYQKNNLKNEWHYYKDGKAWLCKVQYKTKTIVWMSAWKGYMQATIYFSEKYINEVYGLEISKNIKEVLENTKNTGRSKPCIFKITNEDVLKDFNTVMQFKLIAK
jgi:hypothetical protein